MVIPLTKLFAQRKFQGFISAEEFDFESVILENYEWMEREAAEQNFDYKQPVGYCVIYNPKLKTVFLYQRSKIDANYKEKRLQGNWSCGIGGHIEKIDTDALNPIHESSLREISEEVLINGNKTVRVLGYINDDSNDVGKVHFAILYLVEIDSAKVEPLDAEISEGGLVPIEVLKKICSHGDMKVENWTIIALEALKNL